MAKWMNTSEAMRSVGVSKSTLKRWKSEGRIEWREVDAKDHKRIEYNIESVADLSQWHISRRRASAKNIFYCFYNPEVMLEDIADFLYNNSIIVHQAFVEETRDRPLFDYILLLAFKGKLNTIYYMSDSDFSDNPFDMAHYKEVFRLLDIKMVRLDIYDEYQSIKYTVKTNTPSSDILNRLIDAELIYVQSKQARNKKTIKNRSSYYTNYAEERKKAETHTFTKVDYEKDVEEMENMGRLTEDDLKRLGPAEN